MLEWQCHVQRSTELVGEPSEGRELAVRMRVFHGVGGFDLAYHRFTGIGVVRGDVGDVGADLRGSSVRMTDVVSADVEVPETGKVTSQLANHPVVVGLGLS